MSHGNENEYVNLASELERSRLNPHSYQESRHPPPSILSILQPTRNNGDNHDTHTSATAPRHTANQQNLPQHHHLLPHHPTKTISPPRSAQKRHQPNQRQPLPAKIRNELVPHQHGAHLWRHHHYELGETRPPACFVEENAGLDASRETTSHDTVRCG